MSGFQKLVLVIATAALVISLAYPEMEYVSGYDRLVVNGIVVRNDVSTSKDRKYFREAEKPDHRVIYSSVFERAIAIIVIGGVLFLVAGALLDRGKNQQTQSSELAEPHLDQRAKKCWAKR